MSSENPPFGLPSLSPYAVLPLSLLWSFAVRGLTSRQFGGNADPYAEASRYLLDLCDPPRYIEAIQALKAACTPGSEEEIRYELSICTGLMADGKRDEACARMRAIAVNRVRNNAERAIYYNNLAACIIQEKDWLNARKTLNLLDALTTDPKTDPSLRPIIGELYESKQYQLDMARGDYSGAETFFLRLLASARNDYERVNAQFTLGKIFRHEKRFGEARAAFSFVAEHGKLLDVARQARQICMELEKER